MKSFSKQRVFILILLVCAGLTACENTVMEKWWDTSAKAGGSTELYVDNVLKMEAKLPALLAWIKNNITDNTYYIIRVGRDDSLSPEEGRLHYPDKTGVTITLVGKGKEQTLTITDNAKGSLFDVGDNVTFVLSENITLKGHDNNNNALVTVASGGTMIMKDGATVRDNSDTTGADRAGIMVAGILIMDGGSITGNRSSCCGAGVGVTGTFTMNGGVISNNEATGYNSTGGGGVYLLGGSMTMNGGSIAGNKHANVGGGIGIHGGGNFTKTGGIIYGSDASGGLANQANRGGGHAVYAGNRVRNTTLYESDNISTSNWNVGWE